MSGNEFESFVSSVDRTLRSTSIVRDRARTVCALLTQALSQEQFKLDCIERAMSTMNETLVTWRNPPIYRDQELDYRIRMIYWPPHYENNPHEHNTWTVTGVLHNRMDTIVYRWGERTEVRTLVVEKKFAGEPGHVGYIVPPCIHNVANPADSVSVSLHIFSGLGATVGEDASAEDFEPMGTIWYPSPRKGEIVKGIARRALIAHTEILAQIPGQRSLTLLDRIFDLGDVSVKLASVKAMSRIDIKHTARRLDALSTVSPEPARSKLQRLSTKLLSSTERS